MGPFRRQLIILLATATPAMAEVCTVARPGWAIADGPVGPWGELLFFATSVPALVMLAALVAGWVFRQQIFFLIAMLIAVVCLAPRYWPVDPDLLAAGQTEGCMGPSTLVIALLALIWCAALAGVFLRHKGAT
jgi:hypothetical protein